MTNVNFTFILLLSIIAGLSGSCICFLLGQKFGTKILDSISSRFPNTRKGINASYDFFEKHGNKAVCIGRLIPLCRTYISFVAGASKQKTSCFVIFSTLGISIWNLILIGLGYTLGNNWKNAVSFYNNYKTAVIIILGFLLLIIITVKFTKKCKKNF